MRYSETGDQTPWPGPDSATWSAAVSGHQPPIKRQYWPWWLIGGLIFLLLVGLCVVMGIGLGTGDQSGTTGYVTPSPTPRPTSKAASKTKPKAVPEVQKIDEGMFQVGKDVEPGRYKTSGMKEDALMCYWHTAKDTSTDKIIDQGVVDKAGAQAYVTLRKGEWFQTSGCETWVRQAP